MRSPAKPVDLPPSTDHTSETGEPAEAAETRDPERLHAFGGGKDGPPRAPGPERDLGVESWDQIVGPYTPTGPTEKVNGASTFIDPFHPACRLSGQMHRLPPDYQPPPESGLAIHPDGKDVHPKADQPWGHRTIYPPEPMTAAEFAQRVAHLPWEYAGNKPKEK